MADGEEDCNCERWEVEYQEEDRYAVTVVDCHLDKHSEMARNLLRNCRESSMGFKKGQSDV